jgi:cytochrome P450
MNTQSQLQAPAHVPPHLIRPSPISMTAPVGEDPYRVLIPRLHAEAPDIFYAPGSHISGGSWILMRAEDIRAVMLDTDHFSSAGQTGLSRLVGQDWDIIPVEIDPPAHAAYRAVLNPLFSPRKISELEGDIRSTARSLVNGFAGQGRCDFVSAFTAPFPVTIFLRLMDLPVEEMPQFLQWENMLVHSPDPSIKAAAMRAIMDYLEAVIEVRRVAPKEDFISHAVTVEIDGRRLTKTEIISIAFQLYLGGLDTVTQTMGWQFKYLAENPDQQQMLRDNPGLVGDGLEELLRAFATVSSFRTCVKPIRIRDVEIQPGDIVTVSTAIAARDPQACEYPNEIRFDRGSVPNITFAYGPHRCIGSHLARMEMRIALEETLPILRNFRIDSELPPPLMHLGSILGLERLDLTWDR